jgi:putative two-component system response regulator
MSTSKVLVVDDVPANVAVLERFLRAEGYDVCTAADGATALARVAAEHPDVVLLDVVMPGIDGFEVCRRIKQDPATRLLPVVLITAITDREKRIHGVDLGADDFVTKPVDLQELRARVRSLMRIKKYTDDLESAEAIIMSLAAVIEARDTYTQGHCRRLADYGWSLGRDIGVGEADLQALHRGGFLHDVGKVVIPDAVLLKPGRLTPAEYDIVKQHTVVGDSLCGNLRTLQAVRPIVRHHHERLDGSGYPDGLRGTDVPLLAQIVGVVDIYDALTTNRPYRGALTQSEAFEVLHDEVQRGWRDRVLVDRFMSLVVHRASDDREPVA